MKNLSKKVEKHLYKRKEMNWCLYNTDEGYSWRRNTTQRQKTQGFDESAYSVMDNYSSNNKKKIIENFKKTQNWRPGMTMKSSRSAQRLKPFRLDYMHSDRYRQFQGDLKRSDYRLKLPKNTKVQNQHMNEYYKMKASKRRKPTPRQKVDI